MSSDEAQAHDSLSFEEALQRLEQIIETLENDPPGIEEAVRTYEEGIALVRHCQERLEKAELRVQELRLE
ncbi:MAG: exodeoxyribonuclease VII small subunit [Rhodothermales bacterium]|nr:exodeoxyribonuclease VII small subunit [Rhodothermales bacterium]